MGQVLPAVRGRRRRLDGLPGDDREQVRPGPRYRFHQRVPPTAGDHPAALAQLVGQVPHGQVAGPLPVHGQPQVGQRIQPVRVGPALAEQELRPELPDHRRHHRMERAQPPAIVGTGRQRHVHRSAFGAGAAGLGREAGTGKKRQRRLVQAHGEYPRIIVEDLLYAVAVVHVDVHVGDPLDAPVEQPGDRDGRVVVHAEAAGPVRHGVVQPAGHVDRPLCPAGPDRFSGGEGGPGDERGRLVHSGEHRVVRRVQAVPRPTGPHRRDVLRLVYPRQRRVVGRLGRDHADPGPVEYPEIPGQRHGQLDPHRIQRMVAEVVPQQLVRPDDRGVRHERATGRAVSVIHSLHEPTYSAGSGTPASVSARIVFAATTPEPQ